MHYASRRTSDDALRQNPPAALRLRREAHRRRRLLARSYQLRDCAALLASTPPNAIQGVAGYECAP